MAGSFLNGGRLTDLSGQWIAVWPNPGRIDRTRILQVLKGGEQNQTVSGEMDDAGETLQ